MQETIEVDGAKYERRTSDPKTDDDPCLLCSAGSCVGLCDSLPSCHVMDYFVRVEEVNK